MIELSRILFIDIETVASYRHFEDMQDSERSLWKSKCLANRWLDSSSPESAYATLYPQKAGILAEFGKIICISVGYMHLDGGMWQAKITAFSDEDEKRVLKEFSELILKNYKSTDQQGICGHNIREFDIPWICRRMMVHRIEIPPFLQVSGKKPWEIKHLLDTLDMWKFGDTKNYTSLKLLMHVLGLPSPKEDIDGSMVNSVYWEEGDLHRITKYCMKDVAAVMQLYCRFIDMPVIHENQIQYITQDAK